MTRADHNDADPGPLPCVIILAGGQGLRWQATVKQPQADGIERDSMLTVKNKLLVDIGGRPLLWRTIDLLAAAGIADPIVYGSLEDPHGNVRSFQPNEAPAEIIGTFSSCMELWKKAETVLFVLGDVVWSKAAIAQLLTPTHLDWQFFGKLGSNIFSGKLWPEIYAVRFHAGASSTLIAAATQLSAQAVWRQRLWELYRVMLACRFPIRSLTMAMSFTPRPAITFAWSPTGQMTSMTWTSICA